MSRLLDDSVRYTVKWQRRLGLADWQVTVSVGKNKDHEGAVTTRSSQRRSASIKVSPWHEKDELSRADLEQTIVHELLHVKFTDVVVRAKDYIKHFAGEGCLGDNAREEIVELEERLADSLALSLVRTDRMEWEMPHKSGSRAYPSTKAHPKPKKKPAKKK